MTASGNKAPDIPQLSAFADIHSHHHRGADVITSIEPDTDIDTAHGEAWYSVGIHPWSTGTAPLESTWQRLERLAADPRVAAIGETGLDKRRGGDTALQEEVFLRHAALAESIGKPLIIHCVGRYGRLIELHTALHPSQQWVVHGFAGKPELARQLMAEGIAISLKSPRPDIPYRPGMIYHETD